MKQRNKAGEVTTEKSMEKSLSRIAEKNAQLTFRFNSSHKWPWTSLSQKLSKTNFLFHWENIRTICPI